MIYYIRNQSRGFSPRRWFVQMLAAVSIFASWLEMAYAQGGIWNTIGPTGGAVTALLSSPTSSSTLYAGTRENGIFVSTDAGSTWSVANNGLRASTDTGRQVLYTVHALATDGQYLYAATASGLYYALANDAPSWTALAGTGSTAPTMLAFDPTTRRLFAAASPSDAATVPTVSVATIVAASAPAPVWSAVTLPAAPGTPIGALAIAPAQGSLTPATLMVGVGVNLYTASIAASSGTLSWVDGDPAAMLQASGAISAVSYSADFLQAYACASGTLFYSGNPFDVMPVWLPANVAVTGTALVNCNAIASVPVAAGGAPEMVLGTDRGVFVSVDGVNFAATGSLGVGLAANAFAIGASAGSTIATLFVGSDSGVAQAAVPTLTGTVVWTPSNGPTAVNLGGSNRRLNNVSVVDTAVLGTTIYGAAVANGHVEIYSSSDSGATWIATQVATVLNVGEEVIALAADPPNSVLYAATTQGLLAYSRSTGRWSAVGASTLAGRVGALAVGTTVLFAGTDNGVFAVPLSGAPGGAVPIAAGPAGASVRSLLVSNGRVYAGTIDAMDENYVVSTSETSAGAGTAIWGAFGVGSAGTNRITSLLEVGGTLLAGTNGSLIRYASAGSAWATANTSNDPTQRISDAFDVVYGLYSDGTSIYAATGSNGVFVSPVGTAAFSWTPFSGSGSTALQSLEVHSLRANGSTLYAATAAGIATSASPTSTVPPVAQAPAPASDSGGGAIDELCGLLLLASVLAVRARRGPRN